ncbi:MAG: hypothetical protein NDI61_05970 [Bdellovibrionaceae bacterium]|nr:hypothetical protein [Pseudobdellovibrionaceae bacterium]
MDIKGLVRSIVPFTRNAETAQAVAAKKRTETGGATDRDADGKQNQSEEHHQGPLTPEQVQDAIRFLEGLQGVKDNHLTVRLSETDGIRVIYIEDLSGKIVRRLAELDLRAILKTRKDAQPKASGNLLNKSA